MILKLEGEKGQLEATDRLNKTAMDKRVMIT